jgi:hypothetical protein
MPEGMREYPTAIGAGCQSPINAVLVDVESAQNHLSAFATNQALRRRFKEVTVIRVKVRGDCDEKNYWRGESHGTCAAHNKESDRHWEEGDDLSLVEFKAIQYRRRGNAVADDEQLVRMARVPKREFMRRGINQHTLEKIFRREPVRAAKLAKCLKVLEEYEKEKVAVTNFS